jgi:hypothetical protein
MSRLLISTPSCGTGDIAAEATKSPEANHRSCEKSVLEKWLLSLILDASELRPRPIVDATSYDILAVNVNIFMRRET